MHVNGPILLLWASQEQTDLTVGSFDFPSCVARVEPVQSFQYFLDVV